MGLERIEANGQEFNPTEHEAVLFQEVADSENTIIEVVRKGYNFNSKVLRASQVIVSKTKIETENSRENTFN
jgi:molecular chaperone GrpE